MDAARCVLQREGITVVGVASTAAEAVQCGRELQPNVTLVDIDLGGESGFDVARRLHEDTGVDPSRVILISAHSGRDYADLIAATPAAGFLPKSNLSGGAIRDLLGQRGGRPGRRTGQRAAPVREPPGQCSAGTGFAWSAIGPTAGRAAIPTLSFMRPALSDIGTGRQ